MAVIPFTDEVQVIRLYGVLDDAETGPLATGDDGVTGVLNNSSFTVQYTSVAAWAQGSGWDPNGSVPDFVYTVQIATDGVSPGELANVKTLSKTSAL